MRVVSSHVPVWNKLFHGIKMLRFISVYYSGCFSEYIYWAIRFTPVHSI